MQVTFHAYHSEEFEALSVFAKAMAEIRRQQHLDGSTSIMCTADKAAQVALAGESIGRGSALDPTADDATPRSWVNRGYGYVTGGAVGRGATTTTSPIEEATAPTEEVEPPKKPRGRPKKEVTIDATPEPEDELEVEKAGEPEPREDRVYTIDDVSAAIHQISDVFNVERALAVLGEFGARSRKTLDEAKYSAFCERVTEIVAEAAA